MMRVGAFSSCQTRRSKRFQQVCSASSESRLELRLACNKALTNNAQLSLKPCPIWHCPGPFAVLSNSLQLIYKRRCSRETLRMKVGCRALHHVALLFWALY